MPLVSSKYQTGLFFRNGHLSTIYAGLVRRVDYTEQYRERLLLSDGDFLDLDWSYAQAPTSKVVVIIHGLEGNSKRAYIKGSAKILQQNGFDVCAVNLRGCSGEPNKLFRSYHSGATEDLQEIIVSILEKDKYQNILLHGFSLGGNLLLKYLGESNSIPKYIKGAVAVSVPCKLDDSLAQLLSLKNAHYAQKFKKNLIDKLKIKQQLFPSEISVSDIKKIKTLKDFDDIYTSKAHGFRDAMDYYDKCSCLQFLKNIKVPSLIINAQNDTFLGEACYPVQEAKYNENLFLEIPKHGGHVGFHGKNNITYSEKRTTEFLKNL
ncbi:YheT family hydrolase [Maribacter sp. CXY002]|uniref:YheT family hydrolase n=1 Tax=Maribacter luteocoastalis TaxID=3407671 RepID=UPI003B684CF7